MNRDRLFRALLSIVSLATFAASPVRAAFGPPDGLGWAWADSDEPGVDTLFETPSSLTPIAASLPDDAVYPITMAFPFTLYGQTSATVYFSTNGWISLLDPAGFSAPTNTDIPDPAPPNATVAYLWDDHADGASGSFAQHGPTPNGHLFFVRHVAKGTGAISQLYVQFYNNNSVKVVYVVRPELPSATIGIESELGGIGHRVAFNGAITGGANFRDNYAVLFYKPQAPACASATPLACAGMVNGSTAPGLNNVTTWGCAAGNYDGREAVYAITLPTLAQLDLTLTNLGGRAQDLFLLRSCDASLGCAVGGSPTLNFPLLAPGTYLATVDGRTATDDGTHTITATCSSVATPLACNTSINDSAVGVSAIDDYSCFIAGQAGPERIYSFTLPTPQTVSAQLTPTAPFDIVLVQASALTPTSTTCLVGNDSYFQSPVRLPAGDYLLIVDGPMGASGNFTLQLGCDATPPIFPLEPGEVAVTCGANQGQPVVGLIDVRDPGCDPNAILGQNWAAPMYHNEMPNATLNTGDVWTVDNLGQVFGVTLDDATPPNIFVTATTTYPATTPVGGDVYRLDGTTGAITQIASLPNSGQGLGNIAYDIAHQQLFVTNHEDGKLYRLDMAGAVLDVFDPFLPDDGVPGFAPLGERLWGVAVWGGRVYFAVWAEDGGRPSATDDNTVWSVALDAGGAFVPSDVTLEITSPPITPPYSNPAADLSFDGEGRMLLAERSMSGDTGASAHQSRMVEYVGGHLAWARTAAVFNIGINSPGVNSAGGAAYTCPAPVTCDTTPRVWASGDWVANVPGPIYGLLGLPIAGGSDVDSYPVDYDLVFNTLAKTWIGSVDLYRDCPCVTPRPVPVAPAPSCTGATVTLDGSSSIGCAAGLQYRWLEAGTPVCNWSSVPTCDVTPGTTTAYTLEIRCLDDAACLASDVVIVNVVPNPVPVLNAPQAICPGDSFQLDASPSGPNGCAMALEYQFSEGPTILQPWSGTSTYGPVTPATTTTYTVEVRCGACATSTQTTVTVEPRPIAEARGNNLVCAGDSTTLDGTFSVGCPGTMEYRWLDGATPVCNWSTTPTCSVTPAIPTTYTLEVRCQGGVCPATTTINVDVAPRPVAAVSPDQNVCAPGPVQLDASTSNTTGCPGGPSYAWWQGPTLVQPASPIATYTPPTTAPGTLTYTVVVSCAGLPACDDQVNVNVTVRDCTLAVHFDAVAATRVDRTHVAIAWRTSSELGTVLFAVERATSPTGPFELVATTPAQGGGASYRVDDQVDPATTDLWYRVVEHTVDGRGDESAVVGLSKPGARGGRSRAAKR